MSGKIRPLAVSVIGLGAMGGPIARHVADGGYQLTIYSRTRATVDKWLAANPDKARRVAQSVCEAAEHADVVITCIGDDKDLREVVLAENGVMSTLRAEALYIDHTTASIGIAHEIAAAADARRVLCIDAPVTGGQIGAEAGALSTMCGGSVAAVKAARPLLEKYSARVVHVGSAGAGQKAKMVNQVCIAGIIGSLSEGLRMAQAFGLDMAKVHEAISGGAAQSWQMDNRWHSMAADSFDFGGAVDLMRKDLGLALDEGRSLGLSLAVTALVDQFYAEVQTSGRGRCDVSALVTRYPLVTERR